MELEFISLKLSLFNLWRYVNSRVYGLFANEADRSPDPKAPVGHWRRSRSISAAAFSFSYIKARQLPELFT